jgi:hypothetical protein
VKTAQSNRIRTAVQIPGGIPSTHSIQTIQTWGTYWLADPSTPELTYLFPRRDDYDDARTTGSAIIETILAKNFKHLSPQPTTSSRIRPKTSIHSYKLPAMLVASH